MNILHFNKFFLFLKQVCAFLFLSKKHIKSFEKKILIKKLKIFKAIRKKAESFKLKT